MERDAGIPIRWYDLLVHLEDEPGGLRMNELAERILYSKSGFTRVVDRMEEAGLVRRERPEKDRRSFLVVLTDQGRGTLETARRHHRHAIEEHFSRHLSDADVKALPRAFAASRIAAVCAQETFPLTGACDALITRTMRPGGGSLSSRPRGGVLPASVLHRWEPQAGSSHRCAPCAC